VGKSFQTGQDNAKQWANLFFPSGEKTTPNVMPKSIARPTPKQAPYAPNITIPYSQTGEPYQVPENIAQPILNAFNDINQATNAATVLNHPPMLSPISGKTTYGENASFKTANIDIPNNDGSIDRGLFRINSNTFNGMLQDPFWGKAMQKYGINNWDDMMDLQKNAFMARLIYQRQGWGAWVAAPPKLIEQGAPDLAYLSKLMGGN
ncbi:MAG: hypothetical protein KKH44_08485, partial [Bacteroidetes bacterium]|nr:hypothetical protein [Bacteroidota bacterium]